MSYGGADGIEEAPVVGVSTDEPVVTAGGGVTQNLWVATNSALYLLRPGDRKFTRFDGNDGLHLPGFPAAACDDSAGTLRPCPEGAAGQPGISEIVGGGHDEVFVGYYGFHDWSRQDDGTWTDPWRHSGKLDRVRLKTDKSGALSLEVIRFDMVSNNSVEFWHNKTVWKMVYDHRIHPHELFVGTDHGVAAHGFASLSLCFLGCTDRALAHNRDGIELAKSLGQPFNVAYALLSGAGSPCISATTRPGAGGISTTMPAP